MNVASIWTRDAHQNTLRIMSGFFGYDTSLPERRAGQPSSAPRSFSGFAATNVNQTFSLPTSGEQEDLAVYQWGDTMEEGDELNEDTFGGMDDEPGTFGSRAHLRCRTSELGHGY